MKYYNSFVKNLAQGNYAYGEVVIAISDRYDITDEPVTLILEAVAIAISFKNNTYLL